MGKHLCLQPVAKKQGEVVEQETLERLRLDLPKVFCLECRIASPVTLPDSAYLPVRGQYLASEILAGIKNHRYMEADRILAVTNIDLCAEGLSFVFGQAELGGRLGIISTYRLRASTSLGDGRLYYGRVLKEAIHELGHTFGLVHCPDVLCIMYSSNTLEDTDLKGPGFCSDCKLKLEKYLRRLIYR